MLPFFRNSPDGDTHEAKRALLRLPRWLWWVALAPVGLYLLGEATVPGRRLGFPLDDSWIHLVFARNLAHGVGLAFEPGQIVTGSTAPLWTALLSLAYLLPGSPVFWTKLLGIACHLAVACVGYRLARALDLSPALASLATFLLVTTDWMVWSALSGMEISLFTLLTLWGILLHLRERRDPTRPPLSLGIFGLAILARPEGALLACLAVADRLLLVPTVADPTPAPQQQGASRQGDPRQRTSRLRGLGAGLGLAVLAALPVLVYHQIVGGSPVPTTFGAKTQSALAFPPRLEDLWTVLSMLFGRQPITTLFAAGGLAALVARLGKPKDHGLLPALWFFGLPLSYSLLRTHDGALPVGNFGRYYFPLIPMVILLGVLGLQPLLAALGRWGRVWRVTAMVAIVLPTVWALGSGVRHYTRNIADVRASDYQAGLWIRDHVPPGATVAVDDIGAIQYLAPHRLIDMNGLVTPEIRDAIAPAMSAADPRGDRGVLRFLEAHRPGFIVGFPNWHPCVMTDPRFRLAFAFSFEGNITMGGNTVAILATPWAEEGTGGYTGALSPNPWPRPDFCDLPIEPFATAR